MIKKVFGILVFTALNLLAPSTSAQFKVEVSGAWA
jgi:hypothetical protein